MTQLTRRRGMDRLLLLAALSLSVMLAAGCRSINQWYDPVPGCPQISSYYGDIRGQGGVRSIPHN